MRDKFCGTCGLGLTPSDAFCTGCGRVLMQSQSGAHQAQSYNRTEGSSFNTATPLRTEAPPVSRKPETVQKVRTRYYWLSAVAIFAIGLLIGLPDTIIGVSLAIVATMFVYNDGKTRGMKGLWAWAFGTFMLFIVFFPAYLIFRKPLLTIG